MLLEEEKREGENERDPNVSMSVKYSLSFVVHFFIFYTQLFVAFI